MASYLDHRVQVKYIVSELQKIQFKFFSIYFFARKEPINHFQTTTVSPWWYFPILSEHLRHPLERLFLKPDKGLTMLKKKQHWVVYHRFIWSLSPTCKHTHKHTQTRKNTRTRRHTHTTYLSQFEQPTHHVSPFLENVCNNFFHLPKLICWSIICPQTRNGE